MNNPDVRGLFWGVDIGGSTIVIGHLDRDFRSTVTLDMDPREDPDRVTESIASSISELDPCPKAVGVGIAGLVDAKEGVLIASPNLPKWHDYHLRERLSRLTECPVIVDNDCNVFAFGSVRRGRIPCSGLWLMVTLGTGIGGTIVLDGRIVYGTGYAGEFGHMTVEAFGEECPCGSRGCWERYAAAGALRRYYRGYGGDGGLQPRLIAERAGLGDDGALKAFREFGRWLGIGLVNLYHCLNPRGVFMAGGLLGASDHFLPAARTEFDSRCRYDWNVRVLPASSQAGAEGAALMALEVPGTAEDGC